MSCRDEAVDPSIDMALPGIISYAIVFLLTLPITYSSCPLLQRQRRVCETANATTGATWRCGEHAIRCPDSSGEIRFYGEGEWNPIKEFSYEDRLLLVQGNGVNARLARHYECGLMYGFAPPGPPLPRPIPFQDSLVSAATLFNCEVDKYNFSRDAFTAAYNSTGCSSFDLYYTFEYDGEPLTDSPANCTDSGHHFEWWLRFDESGRSLSVVAAGFSHLRKLRPDCFTCRMTRDSCSPEGVRNSTSCSCGKRCSEASLKKSTHMVKIVLGVTATIITFLLSSLFILYYFFRKKLYLLGKWRSRSIRNVEDFLEQYGSLIPKRYNYSDIKKMTASFSNKLGQGGYGKVFKGKLRNGHLVAVKVLNESNGNGEEFVNEVASIGRTFHVNIVSLLGFCSEGTKRALIYEFMPNGSLEKFIFSEGLRDSLQWKKLYEIAVGIARGLEYLHHGCNIVHFDIKPQNILLDQEFGPKISDFGLAKLCHPKESVLSMAGTRGTIGYIAPEVFSRNFGVISSKSDVYSYGMMLLEMVGGRKNAEARLDNISQVYFPHWVYEQLVNNEHLEIFDANIEIEDIARKMIIIGLWCIQTSPKCRPSMNNVVEMLEGRVEDLEMPPKPYLSSPSTSHSDSSS